MVAGQWRTAVLGVLPSVLRALGPAWALSILVAAVGSVVAAAPASAGTITRGEVSGVLSYTYTDSTLNEENPLTLNYVQNDSDGREYFFVDSTGLTAAGGADDHCTEVSATFVKCDDSVQRVVISLGSGNDRLQTDHAISSDDGVPDPARIDGGSGDDRLEGTDQNDSIIAGGGNDQLFGFGGGDTLDGGAGADELRGSNDPDFAADISDAPDLADDILPGRDTDQSFGDLDADTITETTSDTGDDAVQGGPANDTITDLGGANSIKGGEGDDEITTGVGGDTVDGGGDSDTIVDQGGTNTLRGAAGTDSITGGPANDTIEGGASDDTLRGGAGNDRIFGAATGSTAGDTQDTITPGLGRDTVNGGLNGTGGDRVSYSEGVRTAGVTVTLTTNNNDGSVEDEVAGLRDTLTEIENVTGTSFNDDITGDAGANSFSGGVGNDVLRGAGGSDTLSGGEDDDAALGGDGSDTMNGGNGSADLVDYGDRAGPVKVTLNSPGAADDDGSISNDGATATTLDDVDNIEIAVGGSADDNLIADATGGSVLRGNAGDDSLTGGGGPDTVDGGAGADTMDGKQGIDLVTYRAVSEAVTITLNDGAANDGGVADTSGANRDITVNLENATGGSGNDSLAGDSGANVLDGGTGDDVLRGLLGPDHLAGGAGSDLTTYSERSASEPVDVSLDGTANDGAAGEGDLVGADVEATEGGAGSDVLTGGSNADSLLGGDGNDRLTGQGGDDTLSAGNGDDTVEVKDAVAEDVDCGAGNDGGNADLEDRLVACEAVVVVRPPIDADRDGVPFGLDCDDNDPRRFQGATEVPGNDVDEDCVGGPAEFSLISASFSLFYETRGSRLKFTEWSVKNIPAGARLLVTCKPPKRKGNRRACPFRKFQRKFTSGRRRLNLLRRPLKHRLLVGGTVIRMRITHPRAIGRVRIARMRSGRLPRDTKSTLCRPPGAKKTVRCG
jgi:Ca2+-binding RTX toxin-like protein